MSGARKHTGSCHCGAVRFEVEVDATSGSRCNCSICSRLGATTAIVKPAAFTLLAGEDAMTAYEWGGRTAKRYFAVEYWDGRNDSWAAGPRSTPWPIKAAPPA